MNEPGFMFIDREQGVRPGQGCANRFRVQLDPLINAKILRDLYGRRIAKLRQVFDRLIKSLHCSLCAFEDSS